MTQPDLNDLWKDPACRQAAVERARTRAILPGVLDVLHRQHDSPTPLQRQNLEFLTQSGAATVCTGQQCGLFLGPLFTLYKALSCVISARAIAKDTGAPVVPVFWIQSEDHDFEEVRSISVPSRLGDAIPVELPAQDGATRVSMQHQRISASVGKALTVLEEHAGFYPAAKEMLSLFATSYSAGTSIADAFSRLLNAVTSETGLLIFNPRAPGAAPLLQTTFQRAYEDSEAISLDLLKETEVLRNSGIEEQVHVREHSPLFFFHAEKADGPRFRLQREGKAWRLVGADDFVSDETLRILLATAPDRFSSSALLRPIMQDTLFPTAAYVAGEAELRYYKQITPLYRRFRIDKPLIIPRAHAVLFDAKMRGWLDELGLDTRDVVNTPQAILYKAMTKRGKTLAAPEAWEAELRQRLSDALSPAKKVLGELDQTLVSFAERTEGKIQGIAAGMREKYAAAIANADSVLTERLRKLNLLTTPGGIAQERVFGVAYYLCRYGNEFAGTLLSKLEPFSDALRVIEL